MELYSIYTINQISYHQCCLKHNFRLNLEQRDVIVTLLFWDLLYGRTKYSDFVAVGFLFLKHLRLRILKSGCAFFQNAQPKMPE